MPPEENIEQSLPEIFSLEQLGDFLFLSVQSVFSTMMGLPICPSDTDAPTCKRPSEAASPVRFFPDHDSVMVGMVGFLGKVSGVLYFYLEDAFAQKLAESLLAMDAQEIEQSGGFETVVDALGEICNMMAGNFKNQLSELNYHFRLTIPSIVRGSNFSVEPGSSETLCYTYPFVSSDQRLVINLIIKVDNE